MVKRDKVHFPLAEGSRASSATVGKGPISFCIPYRAQNRASFQWTEVRPLSSEDTSVLPEPFGPNSASWPN